MQGLKLEVLFGFENLQIVEQGILQHLKILFLETFPDVLSQY